MTKSDLNMTFDDETYSKPPRKTYPPNKIFYNHIDEIWSVGWADFLDYETSNNKGYKNIFVIIDNFSKFLCCISL